MKTLTLLHITTILLTGLIAGLFYGYQCSVNKGLGNLADTDYLKGFQSINRSIQNPVFFLSFMGSIIFLAIVTLLAFKHNTSVTAYLLLAAFIIYLFGVFGVTIFGNVPLNNMLENFNITSATEADIKQMRQSFEHRWNTLHTVRTLFSVIAFLLTIISLRNK